MEDPFALAADSLGFNLITALPPQEVTAFVTPAGQSHAAARWRHWQPPGDPLMAARTRFSTCTLVDSKYLVPDPSLIRSVVPLGCEVQYIAPTDPRNGTAPQLSC